MIDANKDPEVCGKHQLLDESFDVASDGGLQNVFIWVRTPKLPVNADTEAGPDKILLDNQGCKFVPHALALTTKQKLEIKNSDPVGHNSNGVPSANPSFNPSIAPNTEVLFDLPREEAKPFKVGCSIHPWMGALGAGAHGSLYGGLRQKR